MDGKEFMKRFGAKANEVLQQVKGGGQTETQPQPEIPIGPEAVVTLKDIADKLDKLLKVNKEMAASLKKMESNLGPIDPEDGGKKAGKKVG